MTPIFACYTTDALRPKYWPARDAAHAKQVGADSLTAVSMEVRYVISSDDPEATITRLYAEQFARNRAKKLRPVA